MNEHDAFLMEPRARGADRRNARGTGYTGEERRTGDRRKPSPMAEQTQVGLVIDDVSPLS